MNEDVKNALLITSFCVNCFLLLIIVLSVNIITYNQEIIIDNQKIIKESLNEMINGINSIGQMENQNLENMGIINENINNNYNYYIDIVKNQQVLLSILQKQSGCRTE